MSDNITRRNLIAGSTAAAAGAAVLAGAGAAAADEAADGGAWDQEADVVVVGAGMGGLTAAVRCIENGIANVTIVEIGKWPGGGSSYSLGTIHASRLGSTVQEFNEKTQYSSTGELSTESFMGTPDFVYWLDTLGLPYEVGEPNVAGDFEFGFMLADDGELRRFSCVGCRNFFKAYAELFQANGGNLLYETAAKKILTDENNKIIGLLCQTVDGAPLRIKTSQIVLACGGWQNSEYYKDAFLGPQGHYVECMGSPYNTGAGIAMATEVGASLQGDFTSFAGLMVAAEPAKNWMTDREAWANGEYSYEVGGKWYNWLTIVDQVPAHGILVNLDGKRFTDEGRTRDSWMPPFTRQKLGTGVIICDDPTWQEYVSAQGWGLEEGMTNQERIDVITSDNVGGKLYKADTIAELADQMNASGIYTHMIHKANLLKTIEEYNAAAKAGTGADLDPERVTNECVAIENGPFYALPVRMAIFINYGGLAIDLNAQVLDHDRQPIEGLHACSPTAGGMMYQFYQGSMCHAGVTAMWAADHIADELLG